MKAPEIKRVVFSRNYGLDGYWVCDPPEARQMFSNWGYPADIDATTHDVEDEEFGYDYPDTLAEIILTAAGKGIEIIFKPYTPQPAEPTVYNEVI